MVFDWLFADKDDGPETVYGYGRSFEAAKDDAIKQLPDEGYVEVTEATGIDLGARERYKNVNEVDMGDMGDHVYELYCVEYEYRHDPIDIEERGDVERPGSLDGVTHPNDELSSVDHPLDNLM